LKHKLMFWSYKNDKAKNGNKDKRRLHASLKPARYLRHTHHHPHPSVSQRKTLCTPSYTLLHVAPSHTHSARVDATLNSCAQITDQSNSRLQ